MGDVYEIKERFKEVFEEKQATLLAEVLVDTVDEAQRELVKASDFNELKEIVKNIGIKVVELAEAQKRTEQRVEELAKVQKGSEKRLARLEEVVAELAEAQKRTEQRVEELVEVQKKTEKEVRKLAIGLTSTRKQLGGLEKSVSYALENEAYRALPTYLRDHYGIEIIERIVRKDIRGEEIDVFGKGRKDGLDIIIVGEATLRIKDSKKLSEVLRKIDRVKGEFKEKIVPIVITHYATPKALDYAKAKGIIVVQSFEW